MQLIYIFASSTAATMDESSYNNNNKCVAAYFSGVAIATIAQMWLPSGTSKSERASIHMYNNEREKKVRHRRLWKRQQQQRWAKSRTKAYTFKSVWNRKKKQTTRANCCTRRFYILGTVRESLARYITTTIRPNNEPVSDHMLLVPGCVFL